MVGKRVRKGIGVLLILLLGFLGMKMTESAYSKTTPDQGNLRRGKYPVFVTAHRGFSGTAPENTLAAFRAAIDTGCDMIELDVHLSRDNQVVVIHDDTLERTTSGRGNVADQTYAELKRLDAGSWFDPRFSGERIPTLADVLSLARNRILVNIELKKGKNFPYTMAALADRTLREVDRAEMPAQVLFSSFDPAAIDRIRERNPLLSVALITNKPWVTPEEPGGGKRYPTINCRITVLNEANIARAHAGGIRIHAWTVNEAEEMQKAVALGVDGIITNHPDRLIRILQEK
ncbi:MAG TPA: glycerophosphodiester phosphodiesterase [Syntrophus sp. (in: bacteria)]|nr:glycerophosphodiester phosphodiesterase [Syntrophus sp. (in: bacteria)]